MQPSASVQFESTSVATLVRIPRWVLTRRLRPDLFDDELATAAAVAVILYVMTDMEYPPWALFA